jgi:hypothetical protein
MRNFVVLYKPISIPQNFDQSQLLVDNIQIDYLFQQLIKSNPSHANDVYTNYEIDEKSISFQNIGGKTCVVMIAYRKQVR